MAAFCLALAACAAFTRAGEPEPNWDIRVEVQMVAVPMGEAIRLVPRLKKAETFEAAEAQVQVLVRSGEAEVFGWPVLQSKNGMKSLSQTVEEVRYGTEFEPPPIPGSFSSLPPLTLRARLGDQKFEVPFASDTREVGPTLEAELAVDEKTKQVHVDLIARLVILEAMENVIGARSTRPEDHRIAQPRFSDSRVQTALTVPDGGGQLIGAFVRQSPRPHMLLFLLHVNARRIPPARP